MASLVLCRFAKPGKIPISVDPVSNNDLGICISSPVGLDSHAAFDRVLRNRTGVTSCESEWAEGLLPIRVGILLPKGNISLSPTRGPLE